MKSNLSLQELQHELSSTFAHLIHESGLAVVDVGDDSHVPNPLSSMSAIPVFVRISTYRPNSPAWWSIAPTIVNKEISSTLRQILENI